MFKKLDKYQKLIGPSLLINGMIDRYADDVINHVYKDETDELNRNYNKTENEKDSINPYKSNKAFIVFLLGALSILLRQIWYWLGTSVTWVASLFSNDVTAIEHTGWFLPHFCVVLGVTVVFYIVTMIRKMKLRKELDNGLDDILFQYNELEKRRENDKLYLANLASRFEEI